MLAKNRITVTRYGVSILSVIVAMLLRSLMAPLLGDGVHFITFFPAVALAALYGGLGPGILATVLSALVADYFIIPPKYSLFSKNTNDVVQLLMFSAMGTFISWISSGRKIAGEYLRESEERFRLLVEGVKDYAIFMLDTQGNVVSWNAGAERINGYKAEEIIGQHFSRFYTEEDLKSGKPQQDLEIALNEGSYEEQGERLRKDGSQFWANIIITALRDNSGQHVGHSIVIRDITERAQLEEKLRQSQKMEAIGQLAGGVAHDFNNLLTVIIGCGELLLLKLTSDDPKRTLVTEMLKASERATSLTKQLLAFSRQQVLEPKVLNLNDVVKNIEKMLRRLIGEDVTLTTVLDSSISNVKVDPGQIEQVIMNLAVNARDSMPQGGKLTIETREVTFENGDWQYEFEYKHGRYVKLSVTDTGSGISPEVKAHIFEPFFTTKEQGKGTGLGLSTVYGIVKQSGGYITVYSEVGIGTTFKLYFPIIEDESAISTTSNNKTIENGFETVLLVEDEDAVREIAKLILETNGYKVLEASRGHDAIEIFNAYKETIHLVITDVVMPEMSGRQLAEHLRETHQGVKIMFMSGYTDDAVLRHGIIAENEIFLHKPFSPGALLEKVREVLNA